MRGTSSILSGLNFEDEVIGTYSYLEVLPKKLNSIFEVSLLLEVTHMDLSLWVKFLFRDVRFCCKIDLSLSPSAVENIEIPPSILS